MIRLMNVLKRLCRKMRAAVLESLIYLVLEKEDDCSHEWLSILVNGCHSYRTNPSRERAAAHVKGELRFADDEEKKSEVLSNMDRWVAEEKRFAPSPHQPQPHTRKIRLLKGCNVLCATFRSPSKMVDTNPEAF